MPINFYCEKIISLFNFTYAYSFLFGMLGAMLVLTMANVIRHEPKEIATVNITQIIKQFTQSEAKKEITDDALKNEIRIFGKQLEKTLQIFSSNHNLVLVPSEAVITGCDDYTNAVIENLTNK